MTRHSILSTLRRSGAMYAGELGGDHQKLWDMCDEGLILSSRCSDRRYLYTLTEKGRQWLENSSPVWDGFMTGLSWPLRLWRRLFR